MTEAQLRTALKYVRRANASEKEYIQKETQYKKEILLLQQECFELRRNTSPQIEDTPMDDVTPTPPPPRGNSEDQDQPPLASGQSPSTSTAYPWPAHTAPSGYKIDASTPAPPSTSNPAFPPPLRDENGARPKTPPPFNTAHDPGCKVPRARSVRPAAQFTTPRRHQAPRTDAQKAAQVGQFFTVIFAHLAHSHTQKTLRKIMQEGMSLGKDDDAGQLADVTEAATAFEEGEGTGPRDVKHLVPHLNTSAPHLHDCKWNMAIEDLVISEYCSQYPIDDGQEAKGVNEAFLRSHFQTRLTTLKKAKKTAEEAATADPEALQADAVERARDARRNTYRMKVRYRCK